MHTHTQTPQIISVHVGTMLFAGKRYAAEVYPDREVWGYADLAEIAFGTIGKVSCLCVIAGIYRV